MLLDRIIEIDGAGRADTRPRHSPVHLATARDAVLQQVLDEDSDDDAELRHLNGDANGYKNPYPYPVYPPDPYARYHPPPPDPYYHPMHPPSHPAVPTRPMSPTPGFAPAQFPSPSPPSEYPPNGALLPSPNHPHYDPDLDPPVKRGRDHTTDDARKRPRISSSQAGPAPSPSQQRHNPSPSPPPAPVSAPAAPPVLPLAPPLPPTRGRGRGRGRGGRGRAGSVAGTASKKKKPGMSNRPRLFLLLTCYY